MTLVKYPYVVVVIPAYNEEDSIGKVINGIKQKYLDADKNGYWVEIIVVDDGSCDQTVKVAREAGVKNIVSHPFNQGLGAATRTGLERAYEMGADIAVKIDADFQHEPQDIDKVIRPIIEDKADCVLGNRFSGGLQYKMPFYRSIGNKFFSQLVSTLTGLKITDAQTGLMAFSRRYLKEFEMISDYNETQQLILDVIGKHKRIVEVPVTFRERSKGKSFISYKYPIKVLPTIIRMFIMINPLKVFLPIGTLSIVLGILTAVYVTLRGSEVFFGDATISIFIFGGIQIILFGLLADAVTKSRSRHG